jgi:hypothetical protein
LEEAQMATDAVLQDQPKWRRFVTLVAGALGFFSGLCTIFMLVVTVALAWSEHPHAQWPEATAHIERCDVDLYLHQPEAYWIDCTLRYVVGGEEIVSHVHSRTTPAPQRFVYQYPAGQVERMQEWVDEHPERTPITVHYDPANHQEAVLVQTDMPRGGPQTPGNLRLLGLCAASCLVLVTIARIARPRSTAASGLN